MVITKYRTIMLSDSLFISLSQFVAIPYMYQISVAETRIESLNYR